MHLPAYGLEKRTGRERNLRGDTPPEATIPKITFRDDE